MSRANSTSSSPTVWWTREDVLSVKRTGYFIYAIVPPIIIVLGTAGNIMSVCVLRRKALWKSTTSFYLVVLAFADVAVLYTGLLRHWIRGTFGIDIRTLSRGFCKLHIFLVYLSLDFSAWTLVAVTFERFISVCFPLRARVICTRNNAIVIIILIFTVLCGINAHYFWTYQIHATFKSDNSTSFKCTAYDQYKYFTSNVWPWIDSCLASFVPFLFMISCNVIMSIRLMQAQYRRKHHMNISNHNDAKMTSMTAMLLAVTFVFFLTTAPLVIYLIGYVYWEEQTAGDQYQSQILQLWFTITIMLNFTNNAINFLLYCVSGPRFRKELLHMLNRSRVHPEPTLQNSSSILARS